MHKIGFVISYDLFMVFCIIALPFIFLEFSFMDQLTSYLLMMLLQTVWLGSFLEKNHDSTVLHVAWVLRNVVIVLAIGFFVVAVTMKLLAN
ncbi:hypothetical protein [Levilactobacillus cerevisiae]|uniref:hypothetical protein n=1 Tax=Levilactobacillus cerevisiae TaxID=1704076 RepID=UPI000F782B57|nr:hypothetical protein [Levilactobacillus cerevisiae]